MDPQTPVVPSEATPASVPVASTSAQGKPLYRHPIFYVVILVTLLGGLLTIFLLPKQANKVTGDEFKTGLSKDAAIVRVTSDLVRYPLNINETGNTSLALTIFDGLVVYRDGKIGAGLATSWTNPDTTTWKMNLRHGVTFQSGDPFTAADVKFTIDQAKASAKPTAWASKSVASRISEVNVIDDYTVELKTAKPDATLLSWLLRMGIVSQAQVGRDGIANAVGTGAYKVDTFTKTKVSLLANDSYWGGAPKVKALTYLEVSDQNQTFAKLLSNDLNISTSNIEAAATTSAALRSQGYQVSTLRTGNIQFLAFDLNNDKTKYSDAATNPFKNIKVRKAVWEALDIPAITKASSAAGEAVGEFTTSDIVGYNGSLTKPDMSVAKAKTDLADAGFPNGFTVTLVTKKADDGMGQELKKELAEIGITVNLNELDPTPYFNALLGGDFSMILANYTPDTFDSLDYLNTLFHTVASGKGDANVSKFSDGAVDTLLDQASSEFDAQKRSSITKQAHAKIMEDLPAIPVFTRINYAFVAPSLSVSLDPGGRVFGFEISGREKVASE